MVLEGKCWEQMVQFVCSSFAFSKIYCLLLYWTPGMTLQFSLCETGYLVCIFSLLISFGRKTKFCLMKIEAGELFAFSPETTIIEKSVSEPWRSCCATSHGSGSGLVTGEPLNTLLESVECGLGFAQGHSLLALRIWKVAFVFSSSSWSTWPAWLLQRKNPPKGVIADVSMNLARQLTCCSGWFSEMSFLWDSKFCFP